MKWPVRAVALALVVLLTSQAQSAVVFSDDFEAYAPGTNLSQGVYPTDWWYGVASGTGIMFSSLTAQAVGNPGNAAVLLMDATTELPEISWGYVYWCGRYFNPPNEPDLSKVRIKLDIATYGLINDDPINGFSMGFSAATGFNVTFQHLFLTNLKNIDSTGQFLQLELTFDQGIVQSGTYDPASGGNIYFVGNTNNWRRGEGAINRLIIDNLVFETIEPPPPPPLLGDTNNDGVVDLADYNNVVNNLGASGPGQLGDTNGDQVVDLADYNNVVNNLGATQQPASLAVPEPASLALLTLAGLLAMPRRR